MGLWPEAPIRPTPPIITPGSRIASGVAMAAAVTAVPFSNTPGAALSAFSPVHPQERILVRKVGWRNGAAVAGNVELAIYDRDMQQIQTTGSVAQAGVNAVQEVDWTDLALDAGLYYVALGIDSATAALFLYGLPTGDPMAGLAVHNYAKIGTLPLPASIATGYGPSNFVPIWCLATRTLLA